MSKSNEPKFKIGQRVRYNTAKSRTSRARDYGIIQKIEKMYELKDKYKRTYPDGTSCGELTTIKELSKGKFKGYAYRTKSIQPEGYTSDYTTFIESDLKFLNAE